VREDNELYT